MKKIMLICFAIIVLANSAWACRGGHCSGYYRPNYHYHNNYYRNNNDAAWFMLGGVVIGQILGGLQNSQQSRDYRGEYPRELRCYCERNVCDRQGNCQCLSYVCYR